MRMNIIGYRKTKFTPKDSDKEIKGMNLYVAYEQKETEGVACERVFVKEDIVKGISFKVGGEIELAYNRFGKVEEIKVI